MLIKGLAQHILDLLLHQLDLFMVAKLFPNHPFEEPLVLGLGRHQLANPYSQWFGSCFSHLYCASALPSLVCIDSIGCWTEFKARVMLPFSAHIFNTKVPILWPWGKNLQYNTWLIAFDKHGPIFNFLAMRLSFGFLQLWPTNQLTCAPTAADGSTFHSGQCQEYFPLCCIVGGFGIGPPKFQNIILPLLGLNIVNDMHSLTHH